MNNFEFYCPTRVIFGKDTIKQLEHLISKDKKILIIYGGGSIKRNGVYNQVKEALKNHTTFEFGGIEPNPRYETCMQAVELIKKENIDFLLAVGGGSTLDGTKFIAAASKYEGEDPWDILEKGAEVKDALPIGDIITLPATGSEMNGNSVVSKNATNEKLSFCSEKVYPQFSIIDPQVTYTLPEKQTINGIVDTYVHVMEQFATIEENTPLQSYWAIGIIKTLVQEAPKVLKNPQDYDARANIFWCATCGLNYWFSLGCTQDWATHMIGHELTAFYGIDHGQSLAIVLPRLWKNQKASKFEKLADLARDVYHVKDSDDFKAAELAILKTEEFFNSIGMKTKLSDYGINPEEAAQKIKERFEKRGCKFGEHGNIDAQTAYEIIKAC